MISNDDDTVLSANLFLKVFVKHEFCPFRFKKTYVHCVVDF
jgi:hypothetical protein